MKYRIFNKEFNKIVGSEEYYVNANGDVYFVNLGSPNSLLNCNNKVVVQHFIGLKDKNGNEIFEGDFLVDNGGNVGEVVWSENCIALNKESNGGSLNLRGWAIVFPDLKDYPILLSNDDGESSSKQLVLKK